MHGVRVRALSEPWSATVHAEGAAGNARLVLGHSAAPEGDHPRAGIERAAVERAVLCESRAAHVQSATEYGDRPAARDREPTIADERGVSMNKDVKKLLEISERQRTSYERL
jgi:hypothetical protein